jgi:hypothetical protein
MSGTKAARRKYNQSAKGKETALIYNLKKTYGITPEFYDRLAAEQGNRCALCGKHQSEMVRALSVDHEHGETGEYSVRGLLCGPCNGSLGTFGDSIEGLQKAIDYIQKYYDRREQI